MIRLSISIIQKIKETEKIFNEKGVDVHWIIPFDDSSSEFSEAYVELVDIPVT